MTSVKTKHRVECGVALLVLCTFMLCSAEESEPYEIPQPKFKLLKPKGFQVSIPDEHGMQLFAFHGNLNKKMEKMGIGQFSMDVIEKQNGRWIYQNRKLKMRAGDVIYFWTFVIKDRKGYTRDNDIYEVTEAEVNRTLKKVHKLRKRYAYRPYATSDDTPTYGPRFPNYQYEVGSLAIGGMHHTDTEDKPMASLGYGYGHGRPHHHERGYPSYRHYGHNTHNHGHDDEQGHGYGNAGHDHGHGHGYGNGHGHGHVFTGEHTPEYHGSSLRPINGYHNHRYHAHKFQGHGPYFGHREDFHHGHHGHHGHQHGDDCDWSNSSEKADDDNSENNEETNTSALPSAESADVERSTEVVVRTTGVFEMTPDPEAEIMETTPTPPQIDIRFGTKTK